MSDENKKIEIIKLSGRKYIEPFYILYTQELTFCTILDEVVNKINNTINHSEYIIYDIIYCNELIYSSYGRIKTKNNINFNKYEDIIFTITLTKNLIYKIIYAFNTCVENYIKVNLSNIMTSNRISNNFKLETIDNYEVYYDGYNHLQLLCKLNNVNIIYKKNNDENYIFEKCVKIWSIIFNNRQGFTIHFSSEPFDNLPDNLKNKFNGKIDMKKFRDISEIILSDTLKIIKLTKYNEDILQFQVETTINIFYTEDELDNIYKSSYSNTLENIKENKKILIDKIYRILENLYIYE
jgi:hypothetical protein